MNPVSFEVRMTSCSSLVPLASIGLRRRSLLLGLMGLAGLPLPVLAAAPNLDPLTHAAAMHVRATTSVVLALGRAGRAGNRLVAVGERGTILLSDDGQAWRQVPSPVSVGLTGVSFGDDQHLSLIHI